MSKIPTAEEFFREKYGVADRISLSNAALLAVEFAKLHVKAALEAAAKEAKLQNTKGEITSGVTTEEYEDELSWNKITIDYGVYKPSILNAYPDELIK